MLEFRVEILDRPEEYRTVWANTPREAAAEVVKAAWHSGLCEIAEIFPVRAEVRIETDRRVWAFIVDVVHEPRFIATEAARSCSS